LKSCGGREGKRQGKSGESLGTPRAERSVGRIYAKSEIKVEPLLPKTVSRFWSTGADGNNPGPNFNSN
jgi:hypothetical protein